MNKIEIIKQDIYNHHKIIVIKRSFKDKSNSEYFCGYVSRNRVDNKVKLNVNKRFLFNYADENFLCPGGITFHGQLHCVLNFAGDLIGFDTIGLDITEEQVIKETKFLCDQLYEFEEEHKTNIK